MAKIQITFLYLVILLFSVFQLNSQCAPGTLFGVSGSGGAPSSLYSINPATGAATLIGATGLDHITGLAVHPTTGVLYAVRNTALGNGELLTLNPSTGAATIIGATGHQIPDISFNSAGVLYGWSEADQFGSFPDDLITINLLTGAGTIVGDCGCSTARTAIAFDNAGNLYMKSFNTIHQMNPATGTILTTVNLNNGNTHNLLAFNSSNVAYTGTRSGATFTLQTVDVNTGVVTNIGTNAVNRMSAIDFCKTIQQVVPTLNEWGLIILGLLILSISSILVWRQKKYKVSIS